MIRVTFVCLGNICRSPMGEFIFKMMVQERGLEEYFSIRSAGTSGEEAGNPVYPPAKRELLKHGISCEGKRAIKLSPADFEQNDYFLCMDRGNLRSANKIFGTRDKQFLMMSFTGRDEEVADPWYTGDFSGVYSQIEEGCLYFLKFLERNCQISLENN